jgi:hypothetical protein
MDDFPSFTQIWMANAKQCESRRKALLSRLTVGLKYKHMAAATIQRFFRIRSFPVTARPVVAAIAAGSGAGVRSEATDFSLNFSLSMPSDPAITSPRQFTTGSRGFTAPDLDYQETAAGAPSTTHEGTALAALRADVESLQHEVREGFGQLQQALLALGKSPREFASGQ